MSFKLSSKTILDQKLCYDLWAKQRISIYRIPKILAEQGIVNSAKSRNVTPQGVWRAACLYMLEHPEIAKADTVSLFSQHGQVWDEKAERDFHVELLAKARQFLSRKRYKLFLKRFPEFKQYE